MPPVLLMKYFYQQQHNKASENEFDEYSHQLCLYCIILHSNMKLLSLVFLLTFALNSNAQKTESLIGRWVFKDVYNKDELNTAELLALRLHVIGKLTVELNSSGEFSGYLMGERKNGTWSNEESDTILLLTDDDEEIELTILELTKDRMVLKIDAGEFVMVRANRK